MDKARNRFANLQDELRKVHPSDERKYKVELLFHNLSSAYQLPEHQSLIELIRNFISPVTNFLYFVSFYRRFKIRLFKNTKRTTIIAHFKIRNTGML